MDRNAVQRAPVIRSHGTIGKALIDRTGLIHATLNEVAVRLANEAIRAVNKEAEMIEAVLCLWDWKRDTSQIASELQQREADVAHWLRIGREDRRLAGVS